MEEIWKNVEGFEGYQVSNLGRVKSLRKIKEIILKPLTTHRGYNLVRLYKTKFESKFLLVHRIVASAFLGKSDLNVNHINGIKTDNKAENLEFITQRENVNHFQTKKNTSLTGSCFHKKINKWQSNIYINGKKKHLGYFETELDAHNAYLKALEENGLTNKYAK